MWGGLPTGPVAPGRQKVGQGGGNFWEHQRPFLYPRKFSRAQPPAPKSGTPGLPAAYYYNNAQG